MLRDMILARETSFDPSRHGYRFSNNDALWRSGFFSGRFLCGGLSYSSLDYFHAGLPIPRDISPPAPGTILNEYILGRQLHAHGFAIPRLFYERFRNDETLFLSGVRMSESFGALVTQIDQRKLIPILLVAIGEPLSTDSHWVVAIGYEMDEAPPSFGGRKCGRVVIYDSNYPLTRCYLTPDPRAKVFRHSHGGPYRTYVPNAGFSPVNPRLPRYRRVLGLPPRSTPRQSDWPSL